MIKTVDLFQQIFLSYGYEEEAPSPVFPCPDKTTLFTCATISVFKRHILEGGAERLFLAQPCLRTQNLKRTLDDNFDPEYLSSFLMLGMLCPIGLLDPRPIFDFFQNIPDLGGRLLLRSSKALEGKVWGLMEKKYDTEYDTRNPAYYRWQYGEESLFGEGLTFAVRQPEGDFLDVGNLVVIYRGGVPMAVEFGFGQETLKARQEGVRSPYATSLDYSTLGLSLLPAKKRLGDALIVAHKLFSVGVRPGSGKASSVLRKALRSLCFLAVREYGERAETEIQHLAEQLDSRLDWTNVVCQTMKEIQVSIGVFTREVRHITKHVDGLDLERKIAEYKLRYGIPESF